jgi:putative transposase
MLRARAGWSTAETARRFGLAPQTIAAWMKRLDEEGPEALVKTPEPVNRFPDAVTALVKKLHAAAPSLGRRKKAELLARAGVVLGASTIKRMLQRPIRPPIKPEPSKQRKLTAESAVMDAETKPRRVVSARYPHHVWHIDITRMPCGFGWWVPWWPFALIARWVLCWHIAFVQDHYSRALLAFEIFRKEPTAVEMCAFLDRAVAQAGRAPRHIVSDRGSQFQGDYLDWCKRHGARPRFGAVGKKGSIAIIERLIKSVKYEYLKTILVPLSPARMRAAVAAYARWYNTARPHSALGGATPAERLEGKTAAKPRIEPRAPYPLARGARRVRGKLELQVSYVEGAPSCR